MSDPASKIVYFTRFLRTTAGGGGCRRFVQVLEACPHVDWELVSSHKVTLPSAYFKLPQPIFGYFKRNSESLFAWDEEHLPYAKNLWEVAAYWAKTFSIPSYCQMALIDDPIYFEPLLWQLKKAGIKVVGMCHNLESLSGAQVLEQYQRKLLEHELRLLRECHLVVTISREETFLLKNLKINTFYFPYFPPESIYVRMMRVRAQRAGVEKSNILMVGTANNKATRQGMLKAIQYWQQHNIATGRDELLLVGYGTESLAGCAGKGVRFLGPLSDEDLDQLLSTVKACLCYQEQASGALTRIPEMLVAGIPVLANSLAARSYYNLKGVIEFTSLAQLSESLSAIDNYADKISNLVPPVQHELESVIERLANN